MVQAPSGNRATGANYFPFYINLALYIIYSLTIYLYLMSPLSKNILYNDFAALPTTGIFKTASFETNEGIFLFNNKYNISKYPWWFDINIDGFPFLSLYYCSG